MRFATTCWHNHNNHHKVYWPISPPDLRVVDLLHKLLRDLAKLGFLDVVHHHGQHGQELVLRQLSWFSSHVDRIFDSFQMSILLSPIWILLINTHHTDWPIAIEVIHPEWEHEFVLLGVLQVLPALLAHRTEEGQDVDKVLIERGSWRKHTCICFIYFTTLNSSLSSSLSKKKAWMIRSPRGLMASSGILSKSFGGGKERTYKNKLPQLEICLLSNYPQELLLELRMDKWSTLIDFKCKHKHFG